MRQRLSAKYTWPRILSKLLWISRIAEDVVPQEVKEAKLIDLSGEPLPRQQYDTSRWVSTKHLYWFFASKVLLWQFWNRFLYNALNKHPRNIDVLQTSDFNLKKIYYTRRILEKNNIYLRIDV